MEVLSKGIHQVAADQTNLFSLSAEIEAVRAHRDGFSIITNEVLSLAERTRHLTNAIRGAASQLRMKGNEAIAELEHVISRVDSNKISEPTETITYANAVEGTGKTVSVTASKD
jgi:methyl-accepting chemotaxis protein